MLICQPIQTVIFTSDFRENAYSFTVESVLDQTAVPGQLIISTSAGYLVTTSVNNCPLREQLVNFTRAKNGNWIAQSPVTIWLSATSPVDGNVTIRNSTGETLVLTLSTATANRSLALPSLTVSQSNLSFASATFGKPAFRVLTVTQQNSDKVVTISTDSPENYQLASDTNPTFTSALTLTPSPVGTHIHVRYLPANAGTHQSNVIIRTEHEELNVPLTGRSSRLPVLIRAQPSMLRTRRVISLLAVLVLGVLSFISYPFRCQLFPRWCTDVTTSRNVVPLRSISPTVSEVLKKDSPRSTRASAKLTSKKNHIKRQSITIKEDRGLRASKLTSEQSRTDERPLNILSTNEQARRNDVSVSPLEESELEKVLNQPGQ
ncbi:hypothetical protein GCM10027592_32360 [Spirosoma flavus]